jgi:hypothetical protein
VLNHAGRRKPQDRFDSRRIAERLAEHTLHDHYSEPDRQFIERCLMFFLATTAPEVICPYCPRYIHKMVLVEHAVYVPRAGHEPSAPKWKSMDVIKDAPPKTMQGMQDMVLSG